MKKITFYIVLFALLLLSSCGFIVDPTLFSSPVPALEGTWIGEDNTPFTDNSYMYHYTKETYTFYSHSKIDRKRYRTWSVSAPNSSGGGNGTSIWDYQWKKIGGNLFYRAYKFETKWTPFNIEFIDHDTIKIDGFELTKQS